MPRREDCTFYKCLPRRLFITAFPQKPDFLPPHGYTHASRHSFFTSKRPITPSSHLNLPPPFLNSFIKKLRPRSQNRWIRSFRSFTLSKLYHNSFTTFTLNHHFKCPRRAIDTEISTYVYQPNTLTIDLKFNPFTKAYGICKGFGRNR